MVSQRLSTDGATPTLIPASSLPKGAVFYQRIPTQGSLNQFIRDNVNDNPTSSSAWEEENCLYGIVKLVGLGTLKLGRTHFDIFSS